MSSTDQNKVRTLHIEQRYYREMKIAESDARWLIKRSKRLLTADSILDDLGYQVQDDEISYQSPIQ